MTKKNRTSRDKICQGKFFPQKMQNSLFKKFDVTIKVSLGRADFSKTSTDSFI